MTKTRSEPRHFAWTTRAVCPCSSATFRSMLRRLWSLVRGSQVPEIGVGMDKNLPYHPPHPTLTAIDLSVCV
ncbi:MAG: hypothetical protein HY328_09645 [Chloroflexi bacterium]|nr:hypothetical protein [Chloroflexota bacterium]